ncbi:hypothetical protein PFISCL1PPCAC_22473, partial [Pristionchus fissidentatus]
DLQMSDVTETGVEPMDTVTESTIIPQEDKEMRVVDPTIADQVTVPSTSNPSTVPPPTDETTVSTSGQATVPPLTDEATESAVPPAEEESIDAPPTVSEIRQERRELRALSGMAAMLAMMRDGEEAMRKEEPAAAAAAASAAPTEVAEILMLSAHAAPAASSQPVAASATASAGDTVEAAIAQAELVAGRKLNRQERRALMRSHGTFEENAAKRQEEEKKTIEKQPEVEPEVPQAMIERGKVRLETVVSAAPVHSEWAAYSSQTTPAGYQPVVYGNNYVRSVRFSNGGRNLATTSQDRHLRMFKFDEEKIETSQTVALPLGGLIYDAVWHPREEWIATSSRDHPIHLWNEEGERILSFRGINHLDELSSANTLRFSIDGSRMYAGYHKYLRIFDLTRPGRQTREIKTWTREGGGQKALLSCIAMHPVYDGVFAVGCYGRSIGLYSDRAKAVECLFEIGPSALTQLEYSADGRRLYAATRNDSSIVCYDLRNPGAVLLTLDRPGLTNQSFAFDLDGSDRFLFSGSSTGELLVFDTHMGDSQPTQRTKATESALVGASLHPRLPLLASCSGERVYRVMELSSSEDEGEETEESERKRQKREHADARDARQSDGYRAGRAPLQNGFQIWSLAPTLIGDTVEGGTVDGQHPMTIEECV